MLTILSLGAGVQSTAMILMAARGALAPMPDCAIFADTEPQGWARAVEVDRAARKGLVEKSLRGELYLHRSLKPLEEVDLSTAEERGQINLFENDCTGMCGV